ncbi:MAG: glutaminyl-peptide cyclotransferase [Fibrobacter sp.]|nr:glutaminyl-peptide cyclotransferase [Fibrobacter sp.]
MLAELLFSAALGSYTILDSAEHSVDHYTQGLFFDGGELYETTGHYGESSLFRYPAPGKAPSDSAKLDRRYFGEGSIKLGNDIFWLTWREGTAFVFDAKTLKRKSAFSIPTEGWGLSFYNGSLLMSDGSANLYLLSPGDKRVYRNIPVHDDSIPVTALNELEVVGNIVYANVWQSDSIAAIDLNSGKVLKWYDFSKIAREIRKKIPGAEVLNGIAFDGKAFWITGKNWPVMYKVQIKP